MLFDTCKLLRDQIFTREQKIIRLKALGDINIDNLQKLIEYLFKGKGKMIKIIPRASQNTRERKPGPKLARVLTEKIIDWWKVICRIT